MEVCIEIKSTKDVVSNFFLLLLLAHGLSPRCHQTPRLSQLPRTRKMARLSTFSAKMNRLPPEGTPRNQWGHCLTTRCWQYGA